MKKETSIILALLTILLFGCNSERRQINHTTFEFTIEGSVVNGEGIELALYIPSEGMDKRLISTIKNGRYSFKGKSNKIENAKIYIDHQLNKVGAPRWAFPIFIEPIKQNINFDIISIKSGNSTMLWTKNELILEPSNTKFNIENINDFFQTQYSTKLEMLNAYENLFRKSKYNGAKLNFFNNILTQRKFEAKNLSNLEQEKINLLFEEIDTSLLSNTPTYNKVKSIIYRINLDSSEGVKFKDFSYEDMNNQKNSILGIVKRNNFTVIDFWWSGCLPCRKFNQNTKPDLYKKLKEQGIEIIGINVDRSENDWINSSNSDNISWINLYAGPTSEIVNYYNVYSYPTKIIVDKDLNIVEFKFSESIELLKLNKLN